jgi:hypothetical protein
MRKKKDVRIMTPARIAILSFAVLLSAVRIADAQFTSPTCVPPNCSPSVIQNIGLAGTTQTASINISGDAKVGSSLNLGAGTFAIPAAGNYILANVASGGAGANLMNLQVAGVSKFIVDLNGVMAAAPGLFNAPGHTFIGDTNTGMYSPGADQLAFSSGGVARMTMNSGGIYIPNGQLTMNTAGVLPTAPGYSFNTDSNTGMYRSAADTLNFSTNGTSRLQIDPAGAVSIPGNLTVTGTFSSTGGLSGSGAGLTNLNATNITTGTLADARLSSNVALLNAPQTFTGNNNFTTTTAFSGPASFSGTSTAFNGNNVTFNNYPVLFTATPLSLATSGGVNLGGSPLVLGASENLIYGIASNASTGSLLKLQTYSGTYDNKFVVDMQGNTTIAGNLNVTGTVTGGGLASASGTANKVAKFSGTSTLTDSQITDNGSGVSIGNNSPTTNGVSVGNDNVMDAGNSVAIGYGLNVPSFTNPVISMGAWDGGTRVTTPCSLCVTIGFRAPGPSFIFKGKQTSVGFPLMLIDGTNAAHDLISSAETPDVDMNLTRTVRFTGPGSIANQRAVVIRPPTYSSANPSTTITNAATFAVSGPPTAGANASIANAYSLWVQSGLSRFDGNGRFTGQLGVNGSAPISSTGIMTTGTYGMQATGNTGGYGVYAQGNGSGGGVYAAGVGGGYGVTGTSGTGIGVYGTGPQGVYGNSAAAAGGYGVYGYANSASGSGGGFVNGVSSNNAYLATYQGGVPYAGYFTGNARVTGNMAVGTTLNPTIGLIVAGTGDYGVYGMNNSVTGNGSGVYGNGLPYGVFGQGVGASGVGVWGQADSRGVVGQSVNGTGVEGWSQTGYAGRFQGNTGAGGALTIEGYQNFLGFTPAPAVSAAGSGRVFFNSATGKFQISENGGAYANLAGLSGSGTAGYVPRFTAATTLANSTIQDNGSTVAIGNTPAAGALLAVGPTNLSNAIIGTTNAASGVGVYGFGMGASSIGLYGQGTGAGVFGLGTTAGTGVGLQGTGQYAGVTGTSSAAGGFGVQGSAPAVGVRGVSTSSYGYGVQGEVTGSSTAYGVFGTSSSSSAGSAGVAGWNYGNGMGGYFQTSGAGSSALYAYHGSGGSAFYANGTSQFTGNVGMGTTPGATYRLDVNGSMRLLGGTMGVLAVPNSQYGLFINAPSSGGAGAIYASSAGLTTITSTSGGNGTAIYGNNQAGGATGIGVQGFSQDGRAGFFSTSGTGLGLHVESNQDLTGTGTGGKIKVRDTATGKFMLIDDNEIQAFDAANAPSFLHINNDGGTIVLTGGTAGSVGVGTPSPDSKMQIYGSGTTQLKVTGGTSSAVGTVVLSENDYGWIGTQTNHALYIGTGYSGKMYIDTAGNVGIGTTSPAPYKLHVAGDVYANGGWLRTSGNAGWYNNTYGGGWYMTDSSYIRNYNGKTIAADAGIWQPDYEPVVYVYANSECCSAPDKPIIAHSPNYPSYSLNYQDNGDRFVFRSARLAVTSLGSTGGYQYVCYIWEQPSGASYGANTFGTCGSSIRYKKDVIDLDLGLETVMKLRPREFTWKVDGKRDLGFIAEEIEKVDPLLAIYQDGKVESVKYPQLTALLAKAMQELNMRVEGMEMKYDERLDDAEERIRALEERVKALEARIKD